MAAGDMYLLKHFQTLYGQQVLNTYHFEQTGGADGAGELAAGFILDLLPSIKAIQSEDVLHVKLEAENLGDPGDFDLIGLANSPGSIALPAISSFTAHSFLLARASKITRNGHKRYAGPVETSYDAGQPVPSFITLANTLATALETEVTGPLGSTWELRIYRAPFDGQPAIINNISGVAFQGLTTQNTRKLGSGS